MFHSACVRILHYLFCAREHVGNPVASFFFSCAVFLFSYLSVVSCRVCGLVHFGVASLLGGCVDGGVCAVEDTRLKALLAFLSGNMCRSVGGIRISMYTGLPDTSVDAVETFLLEFQSSPTHPC